MFGLTQIIRNSFIRLEGFLSVVWKILANFFGKFLRFFANIFGFNKPNYFLESDIAPEINKTPATQPMATVQDITSRRSKNTKVDDYYLNMAREVKKN